MRVAITTPTNWPRVRRGAERFVNELARYLTACGHHVTVLSAHAARSTRVEQDGYTTVTKRRLWHPVMGKAGVLEFHLFFFTVMAQMPPCDVVVCTTFMDAYAAEMLRRLTGVPSIFWVNGVPPPIAYRRIYTMKGAVFGRALRHADEVVVLSDYMNDALQSRFGRGGIRIPPPVDLDRIPLFTTRNHDRPIVLCAAALDDYRKGGRVLMRAFEKLKAERPGARLHIAADVAAGTRHELLDLVSAQWRNDVCFLGDGQLSDLAAIYGSAAVSVLPSLWEGFGMVLAESLAAGTPVVGTRSGAIPEIITDARVGRLFDPGPTSYAEPSNAEGLARALVEALDLSRDPSTALRCRQHAGQFAWDALGPQLESLLTQVAARRQGYLQEKACASS